MFNKFFPPKSSRLWDVENNGRAGQDTDIMDYAHSTQDN